MTGAGLRAGDLPDRGGAIPSIDLATIYDNRFVRDDFQCASIGITADLMGRNPSAHRHDEFVQIHFVESGRFDLRLDSSHYAVQAPALFFTPPAVPHAFSFAPDVRGHVLTLRKSLASRILERDPSLPDSVGLVPFCALLRAGEGRRLAREIAIGFRLLLRELDEPVQGSATVSEGLVQAILALALRAPRQEEAARDGSRRDLVAYRQFLALVDQNFREHWPVSRLASTLGLTEWRLHEITQSCAGAPPKAILRQRLAQDARRQLAFTDAGVKQIADWLGFADPAYFCRFFKRLTGETPSAYREHIRRR